MELNRSPIIERMQSKMISIDDFNFDKLTAPNTIKTGPTPISRIRVIKKAVSNNL